MVCGGFGDHYPAVRATAQHDRAADAIDDRQELGGIGMEVRGRVHPIADTRQVHRHPADISSVQLRAEQIPVPGATVGAVHEHQRCFLVGTGHVKAPFVAAQTTGHQTLLGARRSAALSQVKQVSERKR